MGIAGMAGMAAHDFFKTPLTDSRFSAYSGIAAAGMNPSSYLASAAAASNPMSQYYASGLTGHAASYRDHATAAAQMNQFMSTASNYGFDRYGMGSSNPYVGHPSMPPHGAFPFGSGSGAAGNSSVLAGGIANPTSPMIAAGATA